MHIFAMRAKPFSKIQMKRRNVSGFWNWTSKIGPQLIPLLHYSSLKICCFDCTFLKNDIVIYRIDIWQWKCSIHWKHKFWSVADCKITCSWTITWFTLKPQIMPRTHTLQNVVRQDFPDIEWKSNRNWNKRSNPDNDKPLILWHPIQISAQCTSWKRKVM